MKVVKILPKGQITLPKKIRERLGVKEGDVLLVEESGDGILLRKGKTIFDFAGTLPDIGMTVEEMREKAIEEAVKDDS